MAKTQKKAPTYEGKPCRTCGSEIRYVNSNNCVACAKRRARERTRSNRERFVAKRGAMNNQIPVPTRPSRTGWPYVRNYYGEKVFPDPIVHLGLGDHGKFE